MADEEPPQPTTLATLLERHDDPPPRKYRVLGRIVLSVFLLTVVAGVVLLLSDTEAPPPRQPRFTVPLLDVAPNTAVVQARSTPPGVDQQDWARRLGAATDIPPRTLVAYLNAEARMREREPACGLTWNTLAGVGRVESHHGRYGGTEVGVDGRLSKPIVGVPLDGSPGVQAIKDTDGGRLDGDPRWDRAVGSMQFLPETWSRYALRASGDGQPPDPQNVDDSALTAARYLCASGGEITSGRGWWKAVQTYNDSTAYVRDVYSGADAYAKKAAEIP